MDKDFKYIYGPVSSWRLGSSLGIDLLSQEDKVCNFDCVYCQLGATQRHTTERKVYLPVGDILEELEKFPSVELDYITFSGRGEPSLAQNLGEMIKAVKSLRNIPVAVLTNSSLLYREDVREEMFAADFVIAKLDACSPESLGEINNPAKDIEFVSLLEGIKGFKTQYQGKLALQAMFIDRNKDDIQKFAYLINYIKPDEVQINTPLRHCSMAPLSSEKILMIKNFFIHSCKENNIVSVYDKRGLRDILPISGEDTLKRRGKVKL